MRRVTHWYNEIFMFCPYCERDVDKVIDSRPSDGGRSIRRRRECKKCNRRFTTFERVEKTSRFMVIKRDGTRTPFDPEKVLNGLQAACGKRPIPEEQKIAIVREVEEELMQLFEREVAKHRSWACGSLANSKQSILLSTFDTQASISNSKI